MIRSTKVVVQTLQTGSTLQPVIWLGEKYVRKHRIPDRISLRFGSRLHTVRVAPAPRLDGIRLNGAAAEGMGLASGDALRMQYRPGSNTLRLGPLIGVLMQSIPGSAGRPLGSNTAFGQELSLACRQYGGLAIFFASGDLPSDSTTIRAWVYRNGWRREEFPLPDVLYNRLTTRKTEQSAAVQRFIQMLKQRYHAKVFNERFLDKHEVFDLLRQDAALRDLLPESHLLRNYATLKTMCQKYPIVYLKPVRGSLGKGIIRIIRQPDGYSCQYATAAGTRTQKYAQLRKLFASLSGKLKLQRYQIQRGLDLIRAGQRPMDFRALVQKDKNGRWGITSIVGRIAGNQQFVSNVARGGTMVPAIDALAKSNIRGQKTAAHARLREAALKIAHSLDQRVPEHFAELGIDLAISSDGRVWLLEVNSKPAKNDNTPWMENKIRPSLRQIVLYSRHLCGL